MLASLKRKLAPSAENLPKAVALVVSLPTFGEVVGALIEYGWLLRRQIGCLHLELTVTRPVPTATLALVDDFGRRQVVAEWQVDAAKLAARFYLPEMRDAFDRRHATTITSETLFGLPREPGVGLMSLFSFLGRSLTLRDGRFWTLFGGFESWTGKAVTPDAVMQIATALACIRLTATTVSTLPVHVYRERADGTRERIPDHPMSVVLRQSPNADQTPAEFLEGMVACTMLFGNAYALKTRTAGQVRALTMLHPERMAVRRDPETFALVYDYADPRGREVYTADEVWHLRAFGLGGDLGLSAVQYGRQAFGLALATDEAAARTFANGIKPGGFFVSQQVLNAEQREQNRQNLITPMLGPENAGRIGILEGNFTWQPVTMPLKDAELLASRGLHIQEICRLMGNVPSVLIGHTGEGVTAWGSGIESLIRAWLTTGLGPLLARIEQSASRALLAPADRGRVWCEFAQDGLLRADSEARGKLYASAAQNGWRTRNEIRALENLPPVEGGDVLTAQSNLVPLDKLGTIVGHAREVDTAQEVRQ